MHHCGLKKHGNRRFCCAKCSRAFSSDGCFDWHTNPGGACKDPASGVGEDGLPLWEARPVAGIDGTEVLVWGRFDPPSDHRAGREGRPGKSVRIGGSGR